MSVALMPLSRRLRAFAASATSALRQADALAPVGKAAAAQTGAGCARSLCRVRVGRRPPRSSATLSHRAVRVKVFRVALTECDTACTQVVDHVDVCESMGDPVELPDDENIAFPEVLEAGVKLGAADRKAADTVIEDGAVPAWA